MFINPGIYQCGAPCLFLQSLPALCGGELVFNFSWEISKVSNQKKLNSFRDDKNFLFQKYKIHFKNQNTLLIIHLLLSIGSKIHTFSLHVEICLIVSPCTVWSAVGISGSRCCNGNTLSHTFRMYIIEICERKGKELCLSRRNSQTN